MKNNKFKKIASALIMAQALSGCTSYNSNSEIEDYMNRSYSCYYNNSDQTVCYAYTTDDNKENEVEYDKCYYKSDDGTLVEYPCRVYRRK